MHETTIHTKGNLLPQFFQTPAGGQRPMFSVGQRVRSSWNHRDTGTIVRVVQQHYTDDLFQVAWDDYPYDGDLYPVCRLEAVTA